MNSFNNFFYSVYLRSVISLRHFFTFQWSNIRMILFLVCFLLPEFGFQLTNNWSFSSVFFLILRTFIYIRFSFETIFSCFVYSFSVSFDRSGKFLVGQYNCPKIDRDYLTHSIEMISVVNATVEHIITIYLKFSLVFSYLWGEVFPSCSTLYSIHFKGKTLAWIICHNQLKIVIVFSSVYEWRIHQEPNVVIIKVKIILYKIQKVQLHAVSIFSYGTMPVYTNVCK